MGSRGSSSKFSSRGSRLSTSAEITDIIANLSDDDFEKLMKLGINGRRYFGTDYGREVNEFLADSYRMAALYERPDIEGTIEDLDGAMIPIPKTLISERYVDERTLPGLDINNPESLVGKEITTPGYLSTTVAAKDSDFEFNNYPAKIIITAPEGSKAILGANDREGEILYHRNSSFQIIGYTLEKNSIGEPQIVYRAILKR